MLVQEINQLREILNKRVENCNLDNETTLSVSQRLDELILEYYKCSTNSKL